MSPAIRRSIFHRLFTDGSSRGNPGPAGVGAALHTPDNHLQAKLSAALPRPETCNAAEYQACLHGLRLAHALGARNLLVLSDSRLLVNQMRGSYAVRHPGLARLRTAVSHTAALFDRCVFAHVPRRYNVLADSLANRASECAAASAAAEATDAETRRNAANPSSGARPVATSRTPQQAHSHDLALQADVAPAERLPSAASVRGGADRATDHAASADCELAQPITVAASEPVLRASAHDLARAWAPSVVRLEAT